MLDPLILSELPQPSPRPIYRSFSDRSSWVVSFDKTNVVPSQLAFGVSAPVRHPLYMSSWVFVWTPPEEEDSDEDSPWSPPENTGAVLQLRGIVLRSRLLKFSHVMCCARLSQFVQQFLTRLVLAHPERASLWYALLPHLTIYRFAHHCMYAQFRHRVGTVLASCV